MERYHNVLEFMINKESDQLLALESLKKVWNKSYFHVALIIEYLLKSQLIVYKVIINWIFKEIEKGEEIKLQFYPYYEILLNFLNKMCNKSKAIKQEVKKVIFPINNYFKYDRLQTMNMKI